MVGTGRLKEETARDRLGTGEGQVRDMLGTGSGHAVPRTWQARDRLGTRRPWDWKARDTLGTGFGQAKDRPWTSEGQARDSRAATEGARRFCWQSQMTHVETDLGFKWDVLEDLDEFKA